MQSSSRSSTDHAAVALLLASRALVGVAARSLAGVEDVTLVQFRALVLLAGGPHTVTSLADRLDVHPSTVTRLCDRLVRKRLVRRMARPADRRETELILAAKGAQLVARVTERRRRDLQEIAARMTSEERGHAIDALSAFARAAGEMPEASVFGWPDAAQEGS